MNNKNIFTWPIFFLIILTYIFMLLLFMWVSNIGKLNAFLLTVPFLLFVFVYIILFAKRIKR